MSITVSGLGVHPVKSTAIRPVESAVVLPAGLEGDRRWMVVDADGVLVSARELRTLFSVVADTPATDPSVTSSLRLRAPELPDLLLEAPAVEAVPVRLFSHDLRAVPYGAEVGAWLDKATASAGLRLVWCEDPAQRSLNPSYSRPGDHTGFADGYPVTLASLDSLRRLNDWIVEGALERGEPLPDPLPISRFRANVVIQGAEPFAEDDWTRIRIGEVWFRKAKGVDRCAMTLIDPADLSTDKEPIRTLSRHRLADHKTWFAVQLIPDGTGTIGVGDVVEAVV